MTGMSDQYTRKSHTGEAGNKGEFGTHARSEADITLGGGNLPPITRDVHITWHSMELPSSRHRKLVPVEKHGVHTVTVRHVAPEDAPTAFSRPSRRSDGGDVNYRVIDGELYADADGYRGEPWSPADLLIDDWTRDASGDQWNQRSEEDVKSSIDERASGIIVIDGKTWAKAPEPVYSITTFGFGGNHGGTGLSIQSAPDTTDEAAGRSYFPADQYDEAVEYAVGVATRRGDTESLESLRNAPRIDVTGAFTPGSTWQQAPRFDYDHAYRTEDFHTGFTQLRNGIESVPGAVITEDDGAGGSRRRVDWSKLTDDHKSAYKSYLDRAAEDGILL
ncbi:hypothetical protein [Curtobacterium sp. MCSS17_016]|uniref:hypothetical protein n=1 Tax=Curtobacterium sp. MCSS17_016 TaxID=2175644 RepID=UPI000DA8A710|nr:hypothetical protein [Curtobacterium sp. MCSS17_016]WIE81081.1 hypothetical protein DEJ19_021630 [Curtobacterium sp. MCSS17_016]